MVAYYRRALRDALPPLFVNLKYWLPDPIMQVQRIAPKLLPAAPTAFPCLSGILK
jgi:hypothetical protein